MDANVFAVLAAETANWMISIGVGSLVGVIAGFIFMRWLGRSRLDTSRLEAERLIRDAQTEVDVALKTAEVDAKTEFLKGQEELRRESTEMRGELKSLEKRLAKREDNIEGKLDTLASKERKLEQDRDKLETQTETIKAREADASALLAERREQLLKVARMTQEEATHSVLEALKHELDQESAEMIERVTSAARDEAHQRSREIIITAFGKLQK